MDNNLSLYLRCVLMIFLAYTPNSAEIRKNRLPIGAEAILLHS